jgi:glycosyltransferase involved in cell wall biosynthesis
MNQTVLPNEIIICDDLSDDNTYEIALDFQKKYGKLINIVVYKNEYRMNFIGNFINGVKRASGEYVFLCDQDDVWVNNKIEVMVSAMENNNNILSLNSSFDMIDENDKQIKSKLSRKEKNNGQIYQVTWKSFIKSTNYPGMSMLIKKCILENINYNSVDEIPAHDWLFNEYAAQHNGMYKINVKLLHYRQHKENTVGAVRNLDNDILLKHRIHSIEFFEKTHRFILQKYSNNNIKKNMINMLQVDSCRRLCIENHNVFKLVFIYLKNINYINIRIILGDLLTIMKCLFSKRYNSH